jgi:hypothetical protein
MRDGRAVKAGHGVLEAALDRRARVVAEVVIEASEQSFDQKFDFKVLAFIVAHKVFYLRMPSSGKALFQL